MFYDARKNDHVLPRDRFKVNVMPHPHEREAALLRRRTRSALGDQPADRDEARRMAANFAKLPELLRDSKVAP